MYIWCYFFNKTPLFSPACTYDVKHDGIINELDVAKTEEMKWLDGMIYANSVDNSMSWSKYHSIARRREFETPGINSILPLIKEPIHTLKAQYHCVNITKITISNINPGQIPADTCDQPVYAITKEIQWRYPAELSDAQYFTILGGLHIEQSLLGIHDEIIW